jgi:ELWxxDGT repeat protein/cysteine-rich repeat protein
VNGTLFFWATDGMTGFELWKSDGTAPGTVLVRDIDPTDVTVPSYFQAVGNLLYFTAHNPSFGYELWRSDGTPEGTGIVRNLNLVRSSYPESPANVGGTLFFYGDDGRFGDELWALTPCGNGSVEPGEECDDGNLDHGDGCDGSCRWEGGGPPTSTTTTTSAPGSTVPGASTSTTTLPDEDCSNCRDDDGNGLVDLDDPACCLNDGRLSVTQLRVTPRDDGAGVLLKGSLALIDPLPSGSLDVWVQLRSGDGAPWCARIPASRVRAVKRGLRFDDPDATLASAGGLTRLRLTRAKRGAMALVAGGAEASFTASAGEVDVAFGLGWFGELRTCASSSATLRQGRRGGLRAGTKR